MTKIEKFYSLREWKEYVDIFMVNAVVEVSDKCIQAVTPGGRKIGKWRGEPVNMGTLKERRSAERLSVIDRNSGVS